MNRRNERQKGFTLIELLVVLIILAVLATVLVPALTSYVDDAREKKAVSEAQVCVTAATEWAAVQRTALIAQAYQSNKSFADTYNAAADTAKWSTTYEKLNTAAPTVTGTPALAEGDGQYFLRPEPAPTNDTTTDAMKTTVKTAAGVDGTLQKLQLNADGKVLYLLYTSAEGIPVAYTAAGTAQDPATTVPVATLPEDTTLPEPTEPDHSGDLVFCVKDEYTGEPVPGIKFHVIKFDNGTDGDEIFSSQTTDSKGMVYFKLTSAELTSHFMQFKLVPDYWPEGYQQVFDVQFNIDASDSNGDGSYDSYKMQSNPVNTNQNTYNYKFGAVGKLEDGAEDHLYTFYVRPVPTLELRVWDDDNGNYLNGVKFTLSKDGQSIPITSGLSPTVLDVKLHEKDNLRRGSNYLYMPYKPNDSTNANLLVEFTNCPEGYQYFDNCNITIDLRNENGHNSQLYTEFQKGQSRTDIKCENQFNNNKCIVTIHVKGGKKVNFFVYDGLDSEHTQLPNVKLQLSKKDAGEIATFTTDGTGAGNFTKTLSVGEYTLKLTSQEPTGYAKPADIPFKITRGADGLLTLTGTGANASCVDNANSTVTMLVTKPDTMRFKLRIVDYNDGAKNNDPQWAGVNVRLTGDALDTSFNDQRAYAINSIADNEHTFDITNANPNKTVTVTIVEGKEKNGGYNSSKYKQDYADNFVKSKFEFKLTKNSDGTFTLTPTNNNSARDGYIIGDTVYVYAYPKVYFDYECYPTPGFDSVFGQGTLTVDSYPNGKSVYTVFDSKDTTHSTIQPWKMAGNRNHPEGVPLGSYELKNARTHPWTVFKPDSTAPWYFPVTQDTNGFPVIKDKNGTITKTITAKYTYLPTGS